MKLEIFDHDLENPQFRKGLKAFLAEFDTQPCSGSGACGGTTVAQAVDQPFTKEEIAESQAFLNAGPAPVCPPDAGAVPSQTAPTALQAFGTAPAASPSAPTPAAAAPVPTAPAVPTISAGVELDKNLLPWDGRIHSSSKEKVQDGSWRKRRGVSDEMVKAVEAELRGQPAPVATVPVATVAPPAAGQPWPFPNEVVAPPPPPAAPKLSPRPTNFNELVMFVTSNQIGPERITPALAAIGISQFGALSARSDMIGPFIDALGY